MARFEEWYRAEFIEIEARPSVFKPRRLSAPEYRNTLRSLFGFDLEVAIREAEQTVVEKSMVLKLLPTDPPGESGFVNDTHTAPISTVLWDQYAYLAEAAVERFLAEEPSASELKDFASRAFRRPVKNPFEGKTDADLKAELKSSSCRHSFSIAD